MVELFVVQCHRHRPVKIFLFYFEVAVLFEAELVDCLILYQQLVGVEVLEFFVGRHLQL